MICIIPAQLVASHHYAGQIADMLTLSRGHKINLARVMEEYPNSSVALYILCDEPYVYRPINQSKSFACDHTMIEDHPIACDHPMRVVSMLRFCEIDDEFIWRWNFPSEMLGRVYINMVFTLPEYRRRGYMRDLFEYAIDAPCQVLEVDPHNISAVSLYESMRFRKYGADALQIMIRN